MSCVVLGWDSWALEVIFNCAQIHGLNKFCLFQVRSQGLNEVLGRLSLLVGGLGPRIKNMRPDVSFDDLGHQCVHGTPAGRDVMQHVGTIDLLIERSLDGVHLASDASYAIEQFLFLFCGVSHKTFVVGSLQGYPAGYTIIQGGGALPATISKKGGP